MWLFNYPGRESRTQYWSTQYAVVHYEKQWSLKDSKGSLSKDYLWGFDNTAGLRVTKMCRCAVQRREQGITEICQENSQNKKENNFLTTRGLRPCTPFELPTNGGVTGCQRSMLTAQGRPRSMASLQAFPRLLTCTLFSVHSSRSFS